MRKTMKFLAVALVAALPVGGSRTAAAAEACPDECRRDRNEVLCSFTEITRDGEVVGTIRKWWTNGANDGVN